MYTKTRVRKRRRRRRQPERGGDHLCHRTTQWTISRQRWIPGSRSCSRRGSLGQGWVELYHFPVALIRFGLVWFPFRSPSILSYSTDERRWVSYSRRVDVCRYYLHMQRLSTEPRNVRESSCEGKCKCHGRRTPEGTCWLYLGHFITPTRSQGKTPPKERFGGQQMKFLSLFNFGPHFEDFIIQGYSSVLIIQTVVWESMQ